MYPTYERECRPCSSGSAGGRCDRAIVNKQVGTSHRSLSRNIIDIAYVIHDVNLPFSGGYKLIHIFICTHKNILSDVQHK